MTAFNRLPDGAAPHAPMVSVVMAAYNAEAFVAEAIESVLGQTLADLEFLIVDDASTDGTPAIVARYARADRRIRVFRLARNRGTAQARNAALAHARAPFIAICDDDDIQLPQRLACQVEWLQAHPRCMMVGGQVRPFGDPDGMPMAWLPGDTLARAHVLFQALHVDSVNLFRRELVLVHGLRYPGGAVWEDWVFQAQGLRAGEAHVLPETLLAYRRHAAQQTSPARLMASAARTRATMRRVLEVAGVHVTPAELELHHAISPSPFGLVPDRDFLLRHRDRIEAEAEAWLARLGTRVERAGWTRGAAFWRMAEMISSHLRQQVGAVRKGGRFEMVCAEGPGRAGALGASSQRGPGPCG